MEIHLFDDGRVEIASSGTDIINFSSRFRFFRHGSIDIPQKIFYLYEGDSGEDL